MMFVIIMLQEDLVLYVYEFSGGVLVWAICCIVDGTHDKSNLHWGHGNQPFRDTH